MASNGEFVTLQEASAMTAAYRRNMQQGDNISLNYDADKVQQILDQDGCVGLRTYFGEYDGKSVVVMVGTDADGNDLYEGLILEKGGFCPPRCPEANPLNQ